MSSAQNLGDTSQSHAYKDSTAVRSRLSFETQQ